MNARPGLDDLASDPARAGLLSSEKRQALLAQAASLLVVLASSGVTGDRLLTVKDAAYKLGCAEHTLYRKEAGLDGRLFHDLRRSAARNMDRAGVSRHVAMQITGHKTEAMYRGYNIVSEQDIRAALVKTQTYLDTTSR